MKYFLLLLPFILLLSGCSNVLADDDSMLDQAGYSTNAGFQDQNPGMETSTKMVNAAMRK